jgi:hypothetical protein
MGAKRKKAAHNAIATCRLQKDSDVHVPDFVIYQHKRNYQMPGTWKLFILSTGTKTTAEPGASTFFSSTLTWQ